MKVISCKLSSVESIIRSPVQIPDKEMLKSDLVAHSKKVAEFASDGVAFSDWHWWNDNLQFKNVYCDEHAQWELVPSLSYSEDLVVWYDMGLHPRFSTLKTLLGLKQQVSEARWTVLGRGWGLTDAETEERRKRNRELLESCKTPEDFIAKIDPYLFINLSVNGRRYRVRKWWKQKFIDRTFISADFFSVENQELRRFMLRRGVEIKDVLSDMKKIAKDDDGTLYEIETDRDVRRYLHVVCPSTGQDYLLAVPRRPELDTPKAARRWTFDVPVDAEFAKEA